MPALPATGTRTFTVVGQTFTDAYGRQRSSSLNLPITATAGQQDAILDAIGNLSNAAVRSVRRSAEEVATNISDLVTLDELFDIGTSLVMVYQNTANAIIEYVEIPSPDASVMLPNGSIDLGNAGIQAIDAAVVAAAPALALQRAYLATRKLQRIVTTPLLAPPVEPTGAIQPPALPGT